MKRHAIPPRTGTRHGFVILIALAWLSSCSDIPGPDCCDPATDVIVSDPVAAAGVATAARLGPALLSNGAEDSIAFVSLPPGAVPNGRDATIRLIGDGGPIFATVRDGGFDPVPVAAQPGDSIEIRVTDASAATLLVLRVAVAPTRPPIVVRTNPRRKKTDVPLNSAIVVVFSEPVDEGTLARSSVQLFRGTSVVAGTVRLLQGTGVAVALVPDAPLDPNTDYTLVVTTAVRDLDGDALEAPLTVPFTTGQSSTGPPASLSVSPDTVYMTGGTYQLTATVRDAAGNVLIDQPVTWSSSDPAGLTVSPTGLVTALATGDYDVIARLNELTGLARVVVPAGLPASVAVSPTQATVGAEGDTIILMATVRDARDRLIRYPSVTWTSSAPAVATVAPYNPGDIGPGLATVTGVSLGSAIITATSGTARGTASVTVSAPLPVASVTIAPSSASLLLRFTRQLSATLRDPNGRILLGRPITWTTDNAAVATVNGNGLVTGIGAGLAAVVATSEGVSDTAAITVLAVGLGSVTAGYLYSCGLTTNGAAFCWGLNEFGQLGDGTTASRLVPVPVSGGRTFATVSASLFHTCGLATSGAAYCWGHSFYGQLGDGSTTRSSVPVAVTGGLRFSAVSTGSEHTCGVTTNGQAYCWGDNSTSQLGDGSTTSSTVPVAVTGGHTFSAVSTRGSHTCGLATSGAAYCWGWNVYGQLGDGSTTSSSIPVAVAGGLTFSAVNASWFHTCGLTSSGEAYCWGAGGGLGDGTTVNRLSPVAVSGGLSFVALAGGWGHTCGLAADGAAYCWGSNRFGQLGDGSTTDRLAPEAVTGGLTFFAVSPGGWHTCGLAATGAAYCWGYNDFAQLGDGTATSSSVPVKVAGQPWP